MTFEVRSAVFVSGFGVGLSEIMEKHCKTQNSVIKIYRVYGVKRMLEHIVFVIFCVLLAFCKWGKLRDKYLYNRVIFPYNVGCVFSRDKLCEFNL